MLSTQSYGTQKPSKASATYCADVCRALGSCHAFTLDNNGTCTLLSRAGVDSGASDFSNSSIIVGCFKHALMWDQLGGQIAVAQGAGDHLMS